VCVCNLSRELLDFDVPTDAYAVSQNRLHLFASQKMCCSFLNSSFHFLCIFGLCCLFHFMEAANDYLTMPRFCAASYAEHL